MKLNQEETEVLEEFKRRVQEQFPGEHGIILSIQVYSERHINYLRNIPSQFIQNVDREALVI